MSAVKTKELAGLSLAHEVCLIDVDEAGRLWLTHVQATVLDAQERVVGSIVFNGGLRLGARNFHWVQGPTRIEERREDGIEDEP